MKIKKWVSVEAEVEVDVTMDDIRAELCADGNENETECLRILNRCGSAMKAIPDATIAKMTAAQRNVVASFFKEQSERYR